MVLNCEKKFHFIFLKKYDKIYESMLLNAVQYKF